MNKHIDFTQAGGLFIYQDTLAFLQDAYGVSLDAIAKTLGDKLIVAGCVDNGASVSAGYITYNGEILPFDGGLKATNIIVEAEVKTEQFDDNVERPVYYAKKLKFGNIIPAAGGFAYSELTRYAYNTNNVKAALNQFERIFKTVVNTEREVIIDGCLVSDNGGGNFSISPGTILFDGRLVLTPAYNGTFPAYINDAGQWSTVQPVAGLWVTFDPYTSQYYTDVAYRSNKRSGETIISTVLSDRFDPITGIGKWEWYGFRLSETLKGHALVGLWFGANGPADVYQEAYREMLYKDGSNTHQLTQAELPNFNLKTQQIGGNGYPKDSGDRTDSDTNPNRYLLHPNSSSNKKLQLNVPSGGENKAHNIRQPSVIVALIERI